MLRLFPTGYTTATLCKRKKAYSIFVLTCDVKRQERLARKFTFLGNNSRQHVPRATPPLLLLLLLPRLICSIRQSHCTADIPSSSARVRRRRLFVCSASRLAAFCYVMKRRPADIANRFGNVRWNRVRRNLSRN